MFGRKNVRMSAVESPAWYGVTYIYRSCVFVYLTKTFSWTIAGTNICTSHGSRQYSLRAVEMASLVAKEFQTDRPQCSQESTTLKTGLNRRRRTFMWKSMQLHHQSALSQEFWRIHYSFFFHFNAQTWSISWCLTCTAHCKSPFLFFHQIDHDHWIRAVERGWFIEKPVIMSVVKLQAWYWVIYNHRSVGFVYLTKAFSWSIAGTDRHTSTGASQGSEHAKKMCAKVRIERPQESPEPLALKKGWTRMKNILNWN